MVIKAAEKQLKDFEQSVKMSANPMYKSVKTKGHGTTMRMVARTYAEEAGGEDGDICNIRPLLSKPDFRKLKISTDKKTGKPTYRWSKTTSTSDSCKVDHHDYL